MTLLVKTLLNEFQVKIDLCETSREFRQATFVLYNCARLSKLFQNFDENVKNGERTVPS